MPRPHHMHRFSDGSTDAENRAANNVNGTNGSIDPEPITSDDPKINEEIKAAFMLAPNDLTYKLDPENEAEAKKFVLGHPAYAELQAYIHLGITTTSGRDAWDNIVTQEARDEVANIDATIYGDTVNAFTSVHNNCENFDVQHMGKFKTITASVVQFCNDTIKYISGKNLLEDQFRVLLDQGSSDAAKSHAKKIIKVLCNTLSKRAAARAKECADFIGALSGFKDITAADREKILKLDHKYVGKQDSDGKFYAIDDHEGWVTKGDDKVESYLAQILGKSVYFANEAVKERQQAARDWDQWRDLTIVASTAVTYIIIPFLGWFAAPAVAIGAGIAADNARKDMDIQEGLARTNESKHKALEALRVNVGNIISQISMTEKAMELAINALVALSNSFTMQATQLKSVGDNIDTLETSAANDDERDEVIVETFMTDAKIAWAEVKLLAEDFLLNSGIKFEK